MAVGVQVTLIICVTIVICVYIMSKSGNDDNNKKK